MRTKDGEIGDRYYVEVEQPPPGVLGRRTGDGDVSEDGTG